MEVAFMVSEKERVIVPVFTSRFHSTTLGLVLSAMKTLAPWAAELVEGTIWFPLMSSRRVFGKVRNVVDWDMASP